MPSSFNDNMDEYLEARRRKKIFSELRSGVMNKKKSFSHNAAGRLGRLKEGVIASLKKASSSKPKRDITQEDIDELLREKGVTERPARKLERKPVEQGDGWKEVSLEEFGTAKDGQKERIGHEQEATGINVNREDSLAKTNFKEKSSHDSIRVEHDEKMAALRKKVSGILFKRKEKPDSVKVPLFRREVLPSSIRELQLIAKADPDSAKDTRISVQDEAKKQESKKSFLSNFIEVKTSSEIEREEEERLKQELKQEEEKALKDHAEINRLLVSEAQQQNTASDEEAIIDFSGLFPKEDEGEEKQTEEGKEEYKELNESEEHQKIRDAIGNYKS